MSYEQYSIANPNEITQGHYSERISGNDREIYDQSVRTFTAGFGRVFSSIIPDLKPKTKITKRGKLSASRLYRYRYDSRIFSKRIDEHKDFDLTFVFLLDISGSMSSRAKVPAGYLSRLNSAKAVMKSLIKASRKQLSDKVKVEVLTKSCSESKINDFGNPVFLARQFSTDVKSMKDEVIDNIGYSCPITTSDGRGVSSSTPEMLCGKGVIDFIQNNVVTKNVIVFNLTDGEAWCGANEDYSGWRGSWGNEENRILIKKYFSKIPFVSVLIGYGEDMSDEILETYPNPVMCSDYNFPKKLENVVKKVVKALTE